MNSEIHSINTRYNSDFHQPLVNLTTYKNRTWFTGIKMGLIALLSKWDLLYWYQNGTSCIDIKMGLIVLVSKWDLL